MPSRVLVIGGGITGRLAQSVWPHAEVFDWRAKGKAHDLTRQYGANYLWEPLQGFECRPFSVVTHVDGAPPTDEAILRYKEKIGKQSDMGDWARQFQQMMMGYEIVRWPNGVGRIRYGMQVQRIDLEAHRLLVSEDGAAPTWHDYDLLVSTVPLYALLEMVGWERPPMRFDPIYVRVTPRPPDAPFPEEMVYVNYLTGPMIPYRVTDRAGERHYEALRPMPGLATRKLIPGKIHPCAQAAGLVEDLAAHGVRCYGRYARWTPDELVHETFAMMRTECLTLA